MMALPRAIVALVALLLALVSTACGSGGSTTEPEVPTFSYVIPEGSGERIARGEPLAILPRDMRTKVGETIQIVNDDTVPHILGPWFVGPGETVRQRFVTAGVYEGSCSVHPDGAFTVIVDEA